MPEKFYIRKNYHNGSRHLENDNLKFYKMNL